MTDRSIVERLAGGRPIVELGYPRQRTEGVVGVLWRGDQAAVICAHRCGLDRLPAEIGELSGLVRLDVGQNQLGELPALPANLRELYIYDNQLVRLPPLPKLAVLDANRNRLVQLEALADIEFVYLAANQLSELPPIGGIGYLNVGENPLRQLVIADPAIRELRAEQAQLTELVIAPAGMEAAQPMQLRELALRGNQLERLPETIGALGELRTLDLRGNRLDRLPEALRRLPLDKLDLRWNPLREPQAWLDELKRRGCLVYA